MPCSAVIATIHAALDVGITLLDTGDYYGMGHNELLLRDALRDRDRNRLTAELHRASMNQQSAWADPRDNLLLDDDRR